MKYRMSYYLKMIMAFSMALFFTGCSQGYLLIEGERGGIAVEKQERRSDHRKRVGKIPPGNMPPTGSCRIWYPNTPPGHQPPPGDCYTLSRNMPPGAWLIRG
ncbi:hypothetical protein [Fodinibius sp.]|uniref:hypothetical protein n=1 Tax=Fodinibius sp. TaxID=1872440 RepID=UPI003561D592